MTQPSRPFNTRQEMYLMQGEGLAAPGIHNAMRRRDDEVAGNKSACASLGIPVAGHVDLADRSPGATEPVNHPPIITAQYARLQVARGRAADG